MLLSFRPGRGQKGVEVVNRTKVEWELERGT